MKRRLVAVGELDGFELKRAWKDTKGRVHLESTAGRHIRIAGFFDAPVEITEKA